jgi:hypothetical protein
MSSIAGANAYGIHDAFAASPGREATSASARYLIGAAECSSSQPKGNETELGSGGVIGDASTNGAASGSVKGFDL